MSSWDLIKQATLDGAQRHSGPAAECIACRGATPEQRAKRHDPMMQELAAMMKEKQP